MSGTILSSEGLDERRRRLLYRVWHRGMREMDLLMGGFADAYLSTMSEEDLADFERLSERQDQELLSWLVGSEPVAPDCDTRLFQELLAFHRHQAPINV
jgi:antitoxin CptB